MAARGASDADAAGTEASGVSAAPRKVDADGWVYLSSAAAARDARYGIGGWLVGVIFLLMLEIARAVVETLDFRDTIDHGGLSAWIMTGFRLAMAAWALLTLGLLLFRSRHFPATFTAYALVDIVYLILFGLAFAHVTAYRVFVGVAATAGLMIAALVYVRHSRRVNVTYRKRVRAAA